MKQETIKCKVTHCKKNASGLYGDYCGIHRGEHARDMQRENEELKKIINLKPKPKPESKQESKQESNDDLKNTILEILKDVSGMKNKVEEINDKIDNFESKPKNEFNIHVTYQHLEVNNPPPDFFSNFKRVSWDHTGRHRPSIKSIDISNGRNQRMLLAKHQRSEERKEIISEMRFNNDSISKPIQETSLNDID